MPGPVPKRSSERRRRNKVDTETVCGDDGVVEIPELALADVHPLVVDLYESLKRSPVHEFYQETDWQRARITCDLLSRLLKSGKPSSMMYSALQHDLAMLLTTEGERRRLRVEVERVDKSSASQTDPRVALMKSLQRGEAA